MVTFQATHVLNMNVFTSISISLLIPVLHGAQRQIIPGSEQGFWSAAPSKTNAWVFDNNALVAIYPRCPSGDKCLRLKGYGSEALSYTSSLGYYSVNAEWQMRTELLDSNPTANKCKVFYIVGTVTTDPDNDYINLGKFASDTQATHYSIPLPQADNHPMVGIWFYLYDAGEGAAYINWFRLTGIKITPPPTPYPTIHPTIPTSNPTLSPTAFPTLEPTVSPTLEPTVSPTKNPTSNPTVSPTESTKYPTKSPTERPTDDPSKHPSEDPSTSPTPYPSSYPSNHPTVNPSQTPTFAYEYTTESVVRMSDDASLYFTILYVGAGFIVFLLCVCCSSICYYYHKKVKGEDRPMTAGCNKNDNENMVPKVLPAAPSIVTVVTNEMQRTGSITESVEMIYGAHGVQTRNGDHDDDDDSSVLDEDEGNVQDDGEDREIMRGATIEGPVGSTTVDGQTIDVDVDDIEIADGIEITDDVEISDDVEIANDIEIVNSVTDKRGSFVTAGYIE
eukprot:494560_1